MLSHSLRELFAGNYIRHCSDTDSLRYVGDDEDFIFFFNLIFVSLKISIDLTVGADPNLTDDKGDTVLHIIIREEKLAKCADMFIKAIYPNGRKLDLEIENYDSQTPLLLAARLKRIEIVHSLLKAGASIEGVYKRDGNNILHIAVSEHSEELVSLILNETKIDVNRKNNANQRPIELAEAATPLNRKILKLLRNRSDEMDQVSDCQYFINDEFSSRIIGFDVIFD